MTGPRFYDIKARNRCFSGLAFFYFEESTLITGKKLPVYVNAAAVNDGFWNVFDTAPMLGRVLNAKDDVPHAPLTVVLSYPGWQRIFGGDPKVIGEQVALDQQSATIFLRRQAWTFGVRRSLVRIAGAVIGATDCGTGMYLGGCGGV